MIYKRDKPYKPGTTLKVLLFSDMKKDYYAETEVPRLLYRGDNNRKRLETIPSTGFMVAFDKKAALEYGKYVAVYEFLGGTIGFGIDGYLTKIMDRDDDYARAWHHEVSPYSCLDYGGDLILPESGEDPHGIICNTDRIRLVRIETAGRRS